jgi:hypothetical protein
MIIIQTLITATVAALAWIILEFVGRPLRKFLDLRGEVIRNLVQFANVRARYKDIPDDSGAVSGEVEELNLGYDEIARLESAQNAFRDLAAQLSAFSGNETFALRAAMLLGYDPANASKGLIGLSNELDTYGEGRSFHRKTLAVALKLKDVPGLPNG